MRLSSKLLLLVLCVTLSLVSAIDRLQLYPFGSQQGDERVAVGDDVSSPEVYLETPIAFYDDLFTSLFVNVNGHVSFETEIPDYKGDNLILPAGFKIIAPFLADVDTRLSGNVYYRESRDPSLLQKAAHDISKAFLEQGRFRPESLFIVTWDQVGYFNSQYDPTNIFQLVIASDGRDSFVTFLYPNDGLNWIQGQGKSSPDMQDVPAQAGFDSGDSHRYYMLSGSGNPEVAHLASASNTGTEGVWIFKVGNTHGAGIELPDNDVTNGAAPGDSPGTSCADGGQRTCNFNARCHDYDHGYCCECNRPYIGNGLECIKSDDPQRLSGKVTGTVNGVVVDNVDLHAYVVTTDGRTYTAISRIDQQLGYPLQAAYTVGSVLGLMFAIPQHPGAFNGFMITGGHFNRTASLRFQRGEMLNIRQTFSGQDAQGHMRMSSVLSGTVPNIPKDAKVVMDDYVEEYSRTAPGVIKSTSTHTYRVNEIAQRFTLEQTLTYTECAANPRSDVTGLRLSVSRNFIFYSDKENIVRFSQTNKISTGAAVVDACRKANMQCDTHAECEDDRGRPRCVCRHGYEGNGQQCRDVDECRVGQHECDRHAQCYNTEGAYECRCNPGYTGNGRVCQKESCDSAQNCDHNAECVYEADGYVCRCNPGFRGDGYRCMEAGCNVHNYCDLNAECTHDLHSEQWVCRCNEGYDGDGRTCVLASEECNQVNNCDMNADCIFDPSYSVYQCQCRPGYHGDGFSCAVADCRRDPSICARNARCERRGPDSLCVCVAGYHGDGYRHCSSTGDQPSYMMYAQGMYIMEVPFNPNDSNPGKLTLYIPGQTAVGIDVDCDAHYFYWTDVAGHAISRAKLDGTDSNVIAQHLGSPEGVAVDWLSKNLYWTDSGLDHIDVSRLDGTKHKTLFSDGLVNPRAIAVDPIRGVMFWTDWNREAPKIEKSNMDGTERRILVSDELRLPNGLVIDFDSFLVCWADAGSQKVECVNYDGKGRRSIFNAAGYPFSLTYSNNVFYWTDWERQTLPNINKFAERTGDDLMLPLAANGKLYGLTVVKNTCPPGGNQCATNNGGCRFLCLPTPKGGRTCTCPDDIEPEECNRIALL